MKIALYCRELRFSGGRSVALGIIDALSHMGMKHQYIVFTPDDPLYSALEANNVKILPSQMRGGLFHMLAHSSLHKELAEEQPEILFMMGNLGYRNSPCKQAVLVHNSWILCQDPRVWATLPVQERIYYRLRRALQAKSIKRCDMIFTQTPVMVNSLHNQLCIPYSRLGLLPNSTTGTLRERAPVPTELFKKTSNEHTFKAITISRYFQHKNLDVLLTVADELIKKNRTDIGLYTTVVTSHGDQAKRFISNIRYYKRDQVLHNLGEIPVNKVPNIYSSSDAMLLPTLLESFSGCYTDAMSGGIPVITSDRDFARVVCGDAACYINPFSGIEIADQLIRLADNNDLRAELVQQGREQQRLFSFSWDAIAIKLMSQLESLAGNCTQPDILEHPWMKWWQNYQSEHELPTT